MRSRRDQNKEEEKSDKDTYREVLNEKATIRTLDELKTLEQILEEESE